MKKKKMKRAESKTRRARGTVYCSCEYRITADDNRGYINVIRCHEHPEGSRCVVLLFLLPRR
jgi:hypothetical protein